MKNRENIKQLYLEQLIGPAAKQNRPGAGNDYLVLKSAAAGYEQVNRTLGGFYYDDGSKMLHTTVNSAVGATTASRGDRLYVLEGHTENLTAATSVNLNVNGVSVIGIGEGGLMPKFSATALAGSITISGTDCLLENIWVYSNATDGVTSGITVAATADGSTLRRIRMTEAANTKEFLTWIAVATTIADLTIEDCVLQGIIGGTDANAIKFAGTSADCVLRNNYIYGDFSGAVVDHLTGASTTLRATGNRMANMDAGAGLVFSLKSDGTAYCTDNYAFGNKIDATVFVGAAAVWHQNYGSNTLGDSGILFPAAAAAIP